MVEGQPAVINNIEGQGGAGASTSSGTSGYWRGSFLTDWPNNTLPVMDFYGKGFEMAP